MVNATCDGGSSITELTVDAEGLAKLLGVSNSNVKKRAANRAWLRGELPYPIEVAGCRRWYIAAVHTWLEAKHRHAEASWRGEVAS